MPKVVVAGDANVDIVVHYPRFLDEERKRVSWPNPEVFGGGTSSNTASALAKLGVDTLFVGSVGNDNYGRFVCEDFERVGVDTSGLIVDEALNTIGVFAFVDEAGERYLWGWPRVDQSFKFIDEDKVDFDAVRSADWIHTSGMALTYDTSSRSTITKMFHEARAAGVKTSLDLNLRVDDGVLNADFAEALDAIMGDVDYVLGSGPDEFAYLGSGSWLENARDLAAKGHVVVVRDGANGSTIISEEGSLSVPAFRVEVEDTVGAGDVFNAGFISAVLEGVDFREALIRGNAVSGYTVARKGARDTPNRDQLEDFIKSFS
ncbi:MAG: carbohydrate kinase family protein [Collinsella sp.]|nr:carbohydrate kinase family protein [Collinsella sp.]